MTDSLPANSPHAAIEVSSISVAYRMYSGRPTSLKESVLKLITKSQFRYYSTFDALSNVSFSVNRGEVLGIIGSNGSGKSTLLKVLTGVLTPTTGSARMEGQVASLIELGAGFDPELNAVENIYLNGSLYKRTRAEIKERIMPILEFAELADFAHTPIKYYSSGMFARLGFSAAIDLDPDILIVDEILGVGDERFQTKCMEVFKRFIDSGKTVVLVSHFLPQVEEMADRALLLEKGRVAFWGDPTSAVALYRDGAYQNRLASGA